MHTSIFNNSLILLYNIIFISHLERRGLSMEKILVTGGAGYIGSILVPELLTKGYHVTVIDNFMFKQASLNNACSNKNLAIINGDIRDRDLIKKSLSSADIVIPLASLVGAPLCSKDPYTAKAVNHDAIMMMLNF